MSVHSFQVTSRGGGSGFKYSIEAKSPRTALKEVQEKYDPKTYNIEVLDVLDGTFEDYLGADTVARIEHSKSRLRKG